LKNRFKFVFEIFKVNNINSLIDKVTKIYKKANVRTSFKEYNIDIKKEKKLIIKNVNLQRLNNNPVLIKKIDLENKILID
jgi:alcohol dehydrogenase class IV